jgi:hypothetical protein
MGDTRFAKFTRLKFVFPEKNPYIRNTNFRRRVLACLENETNAMSAFFHRVLLT